jgi:predicted metal-dependent phosphoesterase TrpH
MEVKASLHIHTREDRREHNALTYGIKELVDIAAQSDFKILAITTHEIPVCRREHVAYAALKGLLLIPGVELAMREKKFGESHVVILNLEEKDFAEAQSIKDFKELYQCAQQEGIGKEYFLFRLYRVFLVLFPFFQSE